MWTIYNPHIFWFCSMFLNYPMPGYGNCFVFNKLDNPNDPDAGKRVTSLTGPKFGLTSTPLGASAWNCKLLKHDMTWVTWSIGCFKQMSYRVHTLWGIVQFSSYCFSKLMFYNPINTNFYNEYYNYNTFSVVWSKNYHS